MEAKNRVRREMLSKRNALSPEEIQINSEKICRRLLSADWYPGSRRILVYSAVKNEVDLSLFIDCALREKKQLYFPKVSGEAMDFFRVEDRRTLKKGAFGVPEPDGAGLRFPAGERGVMLVPGVAFSFGGGRIGYGKGYYDRYLSDKSKAGGDCLLPIGIAFDFQLADRFQTESNDVNMYRIITENREVIVQ